MMQEGGKSETKEGTKEKGKGKETLQDTFPSDPSVGNKKRMRCKRLQWGEKEGGKKRGETLLLTTAITRSRKKK